MMKLTFLQIHVIHFGIFYVGQTLTKFLCNSTSLIIGFDVLFRSWYTKTKATAQHYDWTRGDQVREKSQLLVTFKLEEMSCHFMKTLTDTQRCTYAEEN